jgi:hypothetical protein
MANNNNNKKHSILILKIKEKLLASKKHKKDIKLVRIPVHRGILLNEIAAASATEIIRKGEDVQYLILDTELKSYWKTKQSSSRGSTENQENGKERSSLSTTAKTTETLGSRDSSFEENLSSR